MYSGARELYEDTKCPSAKQFVVRKKTAIENVIHFIGIDN